MKLIIAEKPSVAFAIAKALNIKGSKDGYNWYSYCADNPVKFWDIMGLTGESAGVGEIGKRIVSSAISGKSALERANENYEYNKWLEIEYDSAGKINGQSRDNTGKLKIGDTNVSEAGCEMIAVYNAVTALGYKTTIQDVIYYFDSNDLLWAYGHFGVNPKVVDGYLEQCGFKVEEIKKYPAQYDTLEPGVYIYSYHPNEGDNFIENQKIHTVMINITGPSNNNTVYVTNENDSQKETREYSSMSRFIALTGSKDVERLVKVS